jgi:ribonucleoside-diphosphate reductase alpha chain
VEEEVSYNSNLAFSIFDFSDIRAKGAELITTGGKAPGPEPLKICLFNIQRVFERKKTGEYLTTLEVHDIICFIADSILF